MRIEPIPSMLWRRLPGPLSLEPQHEAHSAEHRSASLGSKSAPVQYRRSSSSCVPPKTQSRASSGSCNRAAKSQARRPTLRVALRKHLESLPPELWQPIFWFASPGTLCALRAGCKAWRGCLDDAQAEALWEAAYVSEWRNRHFQGGECMWRVRFISRWWAYGRWGSRVATECTLMGKKAHSGTVTCLALGDCGANSGEGSALSASDDGSLLLWRFSNAGSRAASGTSGAMAQQHHRQCKGGDIRCPQRAKNFYGHAGPVWCLWYDPDGDLICSGGYDATVKLWSLSSERCEATLRGHDAWVRGLDVMQSRRILVSGGSDGALKFWSLASLQCLNSTGPPNNDSRHSTLCLSAVDGRDVVYSGHSELPHLIRWDLGTARPFETCQGHSGDIYAIHGDEPESLLASASKDRTIRVWDMHQDGGKCVSVLKGHTGAVLDLRLRGNRIVSASMDKTVRMWDIRQPKAPITTLEGHSEQVHCVDFRDRMVISGSRDTSLKVWSVV
eukprot:CAMPEP_0178424496 /NCGR_PEP_ID=MMETSP0689_2-20121128/28239_1 /TAXON_ID=160604 /ORGANISM="Amphidinium massartii, Strain CS-259" /LENGTH=500 /DNA_ID=CAMNT_0020046133 /DNA_START=26 /DNA_END=1528 /DNA_ORIENTATION=+